MYRAYIKEFVHFLILLVSLLGIISLLSYLFGNVLYRKDPILYVVIMLASIFLALVISRKYSFAPKTWIGLSLFSRAFIFLCLYVIFFKNNVTYFILFTTTFVTISFSRWTDHHIDKSIRKEYLNSKKNYFLEGGLLNYQIVLSDISEKKINNKEIVKYSKLKNLSFWIMVFMALVLMFVSVLKVFWKMDFK